MNAKNIYFALHTDPFTQMQPKHNVIGRYYSGYKGKPEFFRNPKSCNLPTDAAFIGFLFNLGRSLTMLLPPMLQQVQGVELHRVSSFITEIGNIHPKHNKSEVPSSGKHVLMPTLVLKLSRDQSVFVRLC